MDTRRLKSNYYKIARAVSNWAGQPSTFLLAVSTVLVWLAIGPIFQFSVTYQLIINTITTIVTFLMVFAIQNTQNRDTHALHMKLDELIRVTKGARKTLINIEGTTREIAQDVEEIADDVEEIQQQVAEDEEQSK